MQPVINPKIILIGNSSHRNRTPQTTAIQQALVMPRPINPNPKIVIIPKNSSGRNRTPQTTAIQQALVMPRPINPNPKIVIISKNSSGRNRTEQTPVNPWHHNPNVCSTNFLTMKNILKLLFVAGCIVILFWIFS